MKYILNFSISVILLFGEVSFGSNTFLTGTLCSSLLSTTSLLKRDVDHGIEGLENFTRVLLKNKSIELMKKTPSLRRAKQSAKRYFLSSDKNINKKNKEINHIMVSTLNLTIEKSRKLDPDINTISYSVKGKENIRQFFSEYEIR